MEYVTTTGLRTESPRLVQLLKKGESISLVHRSEVIGMISPDMDNTPIATEKDLRAFFQAVRPRKLLPKARRMTIYRDTLLKKYG